MSPFRLFGRAADGPAARPARAGREVPDLHDDLALDDDPDLDDELRDAGDTDTGGATAWAAGPWTPGSGGAGRVGGTRHARPGAGGHRAGPADDPPTDPYGFPPILLGAPVEPPPAEVTPGRRTWPRLRPVGPALPDALEAAALAGAFAADYLSWDEEDPARRGRALAEHLPGPVDTGPVGDPALLGWDGRGRQRADFALPGLVRPDGDDRVLVDVRVRVTPYRSVGGDAADRAADRLADGAAADVPGVPAAAPAPTGRGWRGGAAYWVRLSVPVVCDDGHLVVDAADETAYPDEHAGPGRRRDDRNQPNPNGQGAGGHGDGRNGTDGHGVDRDAVDRDGVDRDGADRDGSDRHGTDATCAHLNGAFRNGAVQDKAAPDGAARDGADRDGADRDRPDRDGADRDGPEAGDREGYGPRPSAGSGTPAVAPPPGRAGRAPAPAGPAAGPGAVPTFPGSAW